MKFYVVPNMFLLFMITIIFLRHPTLVNAQNDPLFQDCSATFNCGNITDIGYPFWGSSRPEYCGHPSFELNCTGQTAEIKIDELTYRVLEINSDSKNLQVVRTDYVDDLCPEPLLNTTLDWDVLNYASDIQNLSLYYGCPAPQFTFPGTQALTFSCNSGRGFFVTNDLGNSTLINYTVMCTDKVMVQATQSAVEAFERSLVLTQENLLTVLEQGFGLVWDVNNSICETCGVSGGVCGYNSSASSFACYCSDNQTQPYSCGSTSTTSTNSNTSGGTSSKTVRLGIGLAIAAATIISTLLGCYFYFTRGHKFWIGKAMKLREGKNAKQEQEIETFIMNYHSLMPKRYSYSDIRKMTNSFTEKLGQGGFGGVYKGKLSDGRPVAVKVLTKSAGDGEEFINEVASISRTSHVNIVTLLGFCYARTKRALVYEYMPNGSLEKFIYSEGSEDTVCYLERKKLYEIAISIARGLEYLHRGCNTRIVHFDIKPQNILLDEDFCPKIADFGLAKLCKRKESIVSMLGTRGTVGYIAPEVFMRSFGGISYKSDVYSYGMMILEMFGGRSITDNEETQSCSEMYFPDQIYKHLEGQVSVLDQNMTDEEEETVRKMIIVGMWCIQPNPSNRPSMTKVIEMLEGSLELLQIPPKPFLFSATKPQDFFPTMYLQSQTDEETILSPAEAESAPN